MTQSFSLECATSARSFQKTRRFPTLLRHTLAAAAVAATIHAVPAQADIWGYVDETGRAHMASEKIDSRYQLFFKGTKRVNAPESLKSAPTEATPVVAAADPDAAEAIRNSERFRRTAGQTNAKRFESLIEQAAKVHKIDPALVKAVVAVESAFQPDAVSPKGARGLMQVIPDTAERYGVVSDKKKSTAEKLLDPVTNLNVGIQHLRMLMSMFASNIELVLAAYNAGEGNVLKHANKIPPFRETQEYVKKVKEFYAGFAPTPKNVEAKPVQLALATPGRSGGGAVSATVPAVTVSAALVTPAAYPAPAATGNAAPAESATTGPTSATAKPVATEPADGGPVPVFRPIPDSSEPNPEQMLQHALATS